MAPTIVTLKMKYQISIVRSVLSLLAIMFNYHSCMGAKPKTLLGLSYDLIRIGVMPST